MEKICIHSFFVPVKNERLYLLVSIPKLDRGTISCCYVSTILTYFSTRYRKLGFKGLNNFATPHIP